MADRQQSNNLFCAGGHHHCCGRASERNWSWRIFTRLLLMIRQTTSLRDSKGLCSVKNLNALPITYWLVIVLLELRIIQTYGRTDRRQTALILQSFIHSLHPCSVLILKVVMLGLEPIKAGLAHRASLYIASQGSLGDMCLSKIVVYLHTGGKQWIVILT